MTDEHELPDTVIEAIDALESAATDYGRANYDETLRTSRAKIARALADKCSARRELDAVLLAHIPTPPPALQEETPASDAQWEKSFAESAEMLETWAKEVKAECAAKHPATADAIPGDIALRIRMAHGEANADRQTVPDNEDVIQWLAKERTRLVEALAKAEQDNGIHEAMIEALKYHKSQLQDLLSDMGPERQRLNARIAELEQQLAQSRTELEQKEIAKNGAYAERNKVVAAFAKMALVFGWPVVVTNTAIEGWEPEWHNCLYIETPHGQLSWHFHDSEMGLLATFPNTENRHYARGWDGHTTDEKYERLAKLTSHD